MQRIGPPSAVAFLIVALPFLRVPGGRLVASHAARAGILVASASVASTFVRGLLPRSVGDQAVATGVCTAAIYQLTVTAHSGAETLALFTTGSRGMRGRDPDPTRLMIVDLGFAAVGAVIDQVLPPKPRENIAISITRCAGQALMVGGAAGAAVSVVDQGLAAIFPGQQLAKRPLAVDIALGGSVAGLSVFIRHQRAREFGLVDPKRRAIKRAGVVKTVKGIGAGIGAAAGMLLLVGSEQFVAHKVKHVLDERLRRFDIGSPLIGHSVALGMFGLAGAGAFVYAKARIERGDNIVEPAYPEPPASEFVTSGPRSVVPFDTIGKEGRRFVLMALPADVISSVMKEPAIDPIRIVGGYEAAEGTEERARLCVQELEYLGAFDRSLICIASPTGVGYVSYTFTESLEYLTRGDCATVIPQYALVPSAMALFDTHDGVALQRRVLELTRDRIATLPPDRRPKLVQFGESLGAQVALDVAYPGGSNEFDELGLDAGLYLGVPFRSASWNSWWNARAQFDSQRQMSLVSDSDVLEARFSDPAARRRHVMVVHDDDPVNRFSYRLVVKQPWWMGPPATRPPKVPREMIWRPVTTFVLTVIDLLNGMDFKPGEFVRKGHDYRMDSRGATAATYDLPCMPEQAEAINEALRQREQDWAARRLVARKFASARDSVTRTLKSWGVSSQDFLSIEDGEGPLVADVNPHSQMLPNRFGSSGVL